MSYKIPTCLFMKKQAKYHLLISGFPLIFVMCSFCLPPAYISGGRWSFPRAPPPTFTNKSGSREVSHLLPTSLPFSHTPQIPVCCQIPMCCLHGGWGCPLQRCHPSALPQPQLCHTPWSSLNTKALDCPGDGKRGETDPEIFKRALYLVHHPLYRADLRNSRFDWTNNRN